MIMIINEHSQFDYLPNKLIITKTEGFLYKKNKNHP